MHTFAESNSSAFKTMPRRICFTLVASICIAACSGVLQPKPAVIQGKVYVVGAKNAAEQTLAGHRVALLDASDGTTSGEVRTSQDGSFSFSVQGGDYSLWGEQQAHPIHVDPGQRVTVELPVPPLHRLSHQ